MSCSHSQIISDQSLRQSATFKDRIPLTLILILVLVLTEPPLNLVLQSTITNIHQIDDIAYTNKIIAILCCYCVTVLLYLIYPSSTPG